jgi:hypothetical protein
MASLSVIAPGSAVTIGQGISGEVLTVMISGSARQVRYHVGFWQDGDYYKTWLEDFQVEAADESKRDKIGFQA